MAGMEYEVFADGKVAVDGGDCGAVVYVEPPFIPERWRRVMPRLVAALGQQGGEIIGQNHAGRSSIENDATVLMLGVHAGQGHSAGRDHDNRLRYEAAELVVRAIDAAGYNAVNYETRPH